MSMNNVVSDLHTIFARPDPETTWRKNMQPYADGSNSQFACVYDTFRHPASAGEIVPAGVLEARHALKARESTKSVTFVWKSASRSGSRNARSQPPRRDDAPSRPLQALRHARVEKPVNSLKSKESLNFLKSRWSVNGQSPHQTLSQRQPCSNPQSNTCDSQKKTKPFLLPSSVSRAASSGGPKSSDELSTYVVSSAILSKARASRARTPTGTVIFICLAEGNSIDIMLLAFSIVCAMIVIAGDLQKVWRL